MRFTFSYLLVALALCVFFICFPTSEAIGQSRFYATNGLDQIDLPDNVIVLDPNAIAFKVPPVLRTTCGALIDLSSLDNWHHSKSYQLFLGSRSGYTLVDHQVSGTQIRTNLVHDRAYLLIERPHGRTKDAYDLLSRFHSLRAELEATLGLDIIPRICHQILCEPDVVPARNLLSYEPGLGLFADRLDIDGQSMGGWPGGICEQCKWDHIPDSDTPIAVGAPPCSPGNWQPRFNAGFDQDVIGNAPASSPPESPTGDAISLVGSNAFIVETRGDENVVRIQRQPGPQPKSMNCIVKNHPISTGSVCVEFDLIPGEFDAGTVLISLMSGNDQPLVNLYYSGHGFEIETGNGRRPLTFQNQINPEISMTQHISLVDNHSTRFFFELNLDASLFTLTVRSLVFQGGNIDDVILSMNDIVPLSSEPFIRVPCVEFCSNFKSVEFLVWGQSFIPRDPVDLLVDNIVAKAKP